LAYSSKDFYKQDIIYQDEYRNRFFFEGSKTQLMQRGCQLIKESKWFFKEIQNFSSTRRFLNEIYIDERYKSLPKGMLGKYMRFQWKINVIISNKTG